MRQEESKERTRALAKKFAKNNKLCHYRVRIGIRPPSGSGLVSSCNTEEFSAYGDAHAKTIVQDKLNAHRVNGWTYDAMDFVRIVVKEKFVPVSLGKKKL